jgi:hypothetical protein
MVHLVGSDERAQTEAGLPLIGMETSATRLATGMAAAQFCVPTQGVL